MIKEDAKDILKSIKADISGISPKDIHFNDLRKKKKKKSHKNKKTNESESDSNIIYNQEGFAITGIETKSCSYKDIPSKRQLKKKS